MEKKQLLQNNNGFVGFYPDTHIPFYQLQVNIGSNKSTENFTVEQTVTIDDNFIDTFNKTEEGESICIRVDIISDTIVSGQNTPIFEGYKGSSGLYFTHTAISNPSKENERIYIRNFNITNINIEAKTADVKFAQRILAKNEFTGDGTKFLSDNGTYKTIETGDKTNVLILSLEDDLANGQKNSPVDVEVSAALKDAISTGKACVIKSANSDILANLQQIGNNVTIVMEQISRVGQTFVAVNTTITVNTTTNVISDYQTGAIVLETEGDGNKFLSNNGTYKEIPQPDLSNYATKNELNNKANISDVLTKTNTNSYTPTLPYHPATKQYVDSLEVIPEEYITINVSDSYGAGKISHTFVNGQEIVKVNITIKYFDIEFKDSILISSDNIGRVSKLVVYNTSSFIIEGQCQTGDGSITIAVYYIGYFTPKDDVLTKDNIDPYTPTSNYHPATKKYVDDNTIPTGIGTTININGNTGISNVNYDGLIFIKLTIVIKNREGTILGSIKDTILVDGSDTFDSSKIIEYSRSTNDKYIIKISAKSNIGNGSIYIYGNIIERTLTESEYIALGNSVNTDGVLYRVIPD